MYHKDKYISPECLSTAFLQKRIRP